MHSAIDAAKLPRRKPNPEYRSREHLTEREVERLIEATKPNRWGQTELAPTSVQKLIPGLTAPVASFEATVGGSGCPRLVEFFKKISMNARWVPFCVEVPAA